MKPQHGEDDGIPLSKKELARRRKLEEQARREVEAITKKCKLCSKKMPNPCKNKTEQKRNCGSSGSRGSIIYVGHW